MAATEKRMLDREALRSVIQQWNANRLDLFELSEPDEVSKIFFKRSYLRFNIKFVCFYFFRIFNFMGL